MINIIGAITMIVISLSMSVFCFVMVWAILKDYGVDMFGWLPWRKKN